MKQIKVTVLQEKLCEWYAMDNFTARYAIQHLCNGKCGLQDKEHVVSMWHQLLCDIREAIVPVSLKDWADDHSVNYGEMKHNMLLKMGRLVHIYKERNGQWMGKKHSCLCAHNVETLEKALKRKQFEGTPLPVIFEEYEDAYKDVFTSKNIFVFKNLAWHTSVAL